MLLQAVFVFMTIWAFYGFRYSAFHEPLAGNEHFYHRWNETLAGTGAPGQLVELVRNNRLLPEEVRLWYGLGVLARPNAACVPQWPVQPDGLVVLLPVYRSRQDAAVGIPAHDACRGRCDLPLAAGRTQPVGVGAVCVAGALCHLPLMDSPDRLLGHGPQHPFEYRAPTRSAHISGNVHPRREAQQIGFANAAACGGSCRRPYCYAYSSWQRNALPCIPIT